MWLFGDVLGERERGHFEGIHMLFEREVIREWERRKNKRKEKKKQKQDQVQVGKTSDREENEAASTHGHSHPTYSCPSLPVP